MAHIVENLTFLASVHAKKVRLTSIIRFPEMFSLNNYFEIQKKIPKQKRIHVTGYKRITIILSTECAFCTIDKDYA